MTPSDGSSTAGAGMRQRMARIDYDAADDRDHGLWREALWSVGLVGAVVVLVVLISMFGRL